MLSDLAEVLVEGKRACHFDIQQLYTHKSYKHVRSKFHDLQGSLQSARFIHWPGSECYITATQNPLRVLLLVHLLKSLLVLGKSGLVVGNLLLELLELLGLVLPDVVGL